MAATRQAKRPTTTKGRAARKGKPQGPPPALQRVLRTVDGAPVTVHDELVRQLRSAAPVELACAHAGISRATFYEWVRDGSRLAVQVHAGQVDPTKLEHHAAALYRFATDASQAAADAESFALLGVQRLATGGYEVRKERTRTRLAPDGTSTVVEHQVTTETLAPNLAALTLLLERRWPERWNRRQQLEVRVEGLGAEAAPSPRAALQAKLDQLRDRMGPSVPILTQEAQPGG